MKLYVPNTQMWEDFFQRLATGKTSLNQSGGGRRPHVIAVDQSTSLDNRKYPIKAVLPAEQTTAQAKSELEREAINPADVIKAIQSTDKTRRRVFKRKNKKEKSRGIKRTISTKARSVGKKRKTDIFEIK